MAIVRFPYGRTALAVDLPDQDLRAVMVSHLPERQETEEALVQRALAAPIASPPLCELARGKRRVVVLLSDHTRPVPSRVLLPPMLAEIRRGNPDAEITLLIATGCHRAPTEAELREKLGPELYARERIAVHDCDDKDALVALGTLPSGGILEINRLAAEADLLVAEGFIEPHFFAGFSGGRKSVLPGIASRRTVVSNHCAAFIDSPRARTGVLDGNPIHQDMVWAARRANLAFVVNVVIDHDKRAVFAVAGDVERAHEAGCAFLSEHCRVRPEMADLVLTTNGGYPLDQNLYQAVKGMTAAEATVRPGGVILMMASCSDGCGGEAFYRQIAGEADLNKTLAQFRVCRPEETEPDQWQSQILIRVLQRATVLLLSEAPDELVRAMHMLPVHSPEEGLALAREILRTPHPSTVAIPDGVSVWVQA
ncbi:MAG: nickel-dependent lactate racemase [Candidatus Spyradocola sp.]|jgi:nickel-dependent lactate racemase